MESANVKMCGCADQCFCIAGRLRQAQPDSGWRNRNICTINYTCELVYNDTAWLQESMLSSSKYNVFYYRNVCCRAVARRGTRSVCARLVSPQARWLLSLLQGKESNNQHKRKKAEKEFAKQESRNAHKPSCTIKNYPITLAHDPHTLPGLWKYPIESGGVCRRGHRKNSDA